MFNSSWRLMLILSTISILLNNAITLRRILSILFNRSTITLLLLFGSIVCDSIYVSYLDTGFGVFSGLFQSTAIIDSFVLFIYIIGGTIILLTAYYPRWIDSSEVCFSSPDEESGNDVHIYHSSFREALERYRNRSKSYLNLIMGTDGPQFSLLEYPLIILFIILGGVSLMFSSDVVTMFLAIELQSYGLYILVTLNRDSEWSTSAGLTYFLLGGLSSCFILLGLALLYTGCGLTSLDGIYIFFNIFSAPPATKILEPIFTTYSLYKPQILSMGFLIISVGYLFKISAAPFHFWSPDVYDAIPTIVTTFVAIIAKITILIFLLELVYYTGQSKFGGFNWTYILLISSFLSLMAGAIVGLVQFRIKRLLAYSTISHVGFLLLALTVQSTQSIQAFIFYLMQYSLSNINIFFIIILIGYSLAYYVNIKYDMLEEREMENTPIQLITQLNGYFQLNPVLALTLAITLFSFMGIPPLIGFFAKQLVLSAALQNGYYFLTITGILTSVISAVYYLAIVKSIYFDESERKVVLSSFYSSLRKGGFTESHLILSSALTAVVTILTLIILLFILYPQIWLSSANILAMILSTW